MRVGIIGAGSIGNHFAHSFAKAGWEILVLDNNVEAILRFKKDIYPGRYGQLPDKIQFTNSYEDFFKSTFDFVIIGTPPDTHTAVFGQVAQNLDCPVLIEKPACTPNAQDFDQLSNIVSEYPGDVFIGFNHRVARSTQLLLNVLEANQFGKLSKVNVLWDESWIGILNAHPWLDSPAASYLGYTKRGGGALFEHSHGVDLALYMVSKFDSLNVIGLESIIEFSTEGDCDYDKAVEIQAKLLSGCEIHIHQDVVTFPARKELTLEFEYGRARVRFGIEGKLDDFEIEGFGQASFNISGTIDKARPDDFDQEVKMIEKYLNNQISIKNHPLRAELGLFTAKFSAVALGIANKGFTKILIETKSFVGGI
jgi:predicted dehydrogenase